MSAFLISEPRLEKNPFGNGFGSPAAPHSHHPMAAQFMALNNPAAAHAAFLSSQAAAAAAGLPPHLAAAAAAAASQLPVSGAPGSGLSNSSPSGLTGARGPAGAAAAADPQQFIKSTGLTSLEALQR